MKEGGDFQKEKRSTSIQLLLLFQSLLCVNLMKATLSLLGAAYESDEDSDKEEQDGAVTGFVALGFVLCLLLLN